MKVFDSFDQIPFDSNTVLTIGTFDGVHRGHRSLLTTLTERAQAYQSRAVVVTFEPHPQIVLQKPDRPPVHLLTSIAERLDLMRELGVENVVIIPFDRSFADIDASDFVRNYLVRRVGLRHILIGHDHMFGKDRSGNTDVLAKLGPELSFTIEELPPFTIEGTVISSTKARTALKSSDLDLAASLLGYDYFVTGRVVRGDGRGRKIGLPTANIELSDAHKLLPAGGVYCVSSVLDGREVYGMANIGTRPTFTDDLHPTLEVNYFDWDATLYDRQIKISFLKFIRKERKFASLDLFLAQIHKDRDVCRKLVNQLQHTKNSFDNS